MVQSVYEAAQTSEEPQGFDTRGSVMTTTSGTNGPKAIRKASTETWRKPSLLPGERRQRGERYSARHAFGAG